MVVAAALLGAWVHLWWLIALPLAALCGVAAVMAMPGAHVDPENPRVFLAVTCEVALAAGIALRQGRHRRPATAGEHQVSAEVVTADGRLLRASSAENVDLYRAPRAGRGSFGLVTSGTG